MIETLSFTSYQLAVLALDTKIGHALDLWEHYHFESEEENHNPESIDSNTNEMRTPARELIKGSNDHFVNVSSVANFFNEFNNISSN